MTAVLVETNYSNNGIEPENFFEWLLLHVTAVLVETNYSNNRIETEYFFWVAIIAW